MKIKRFVANDMRHALGEVTRSFGADAVVMSSRRLPEGGVEVLAAESSALPPKENTGSEETGALREREEDKNPDAFRSVLREQQLDQRGRQLREQLERLRQQENAGSDNGSARPTASTAGEQETRSASDTSSTAPAMQEAMDRASEEVGQMRSELNGIRNLLQQRLGAMAWEQFNDRSPVQATVWERLSAMGIPAGMSRDLLGQLQPQQDVRQAWRFTMHELNHSMLINGDDPVAAGGVHVFLGPTGAGKTTTIGKLATRYVLEHGPEEVALVTTDSHRIAAHEQLRTLGRILGVTVRVVDPEHSLSDTLDALLHKQLVLVDTAGMHPQDRALQDQLQELLALPDLQKWLVLSATSQGRVLQAAWQAFQAVGLDGCVLSRLDEAASLGEVLALVVEHQLPVAYETHGQNIPDDIRVAHGQRLISTAVRLARTLDGDGQERMLDEFVRVWPSPQDTAATMRMN